MNEIININGEQEQDWTYRLEEMLEAMRKSIDNAEAVKSEQDELLRIVNEAETDHDFSEFTGSVKSSNEEMAEQIKTLRRRADILEDVIEKMSFSDAVKSACNQLVSAFGVFESRG